MATRKTRSKSSAQIKSPAPKRSQSFSKKEAIDFGFDIAKKNVIFFLSVFAILIIGNILINIVQHFVTQQNQLLLVFVITIFKTIFGLVTGMGLIKISLEFVDKKKPEVSDLFYTKSLVNYFLVSLINGIIVVLGFILLIVPGIIFSIKLQYATYLVVDKNMGVVEALKKSWEMTKGVKMNLFLLDLLFIGINILGVLALLVGLIITVPLTMVASAFVYRKLLARVS